MNKTVANLGALLGLKKVIAIAIVISFFLVALHSFLHNAYGHKHDSSCGVYVLEQLSLGGDLSEPTPVLFLFTPYLFLLLTPSYTGAKVEKIFSICAPPHL